MIRYLAIGAVLLSSLGLMAQQIVAVKSHQLGESPQDFTSKVPHKNPNTSQALDYAIGHLEDGQFFSYAILDQDSPEFGEFQRAAFDRGKLIAFSTTVDGTWDDIVADAKGKFGGEPTNTSVDTVQNGYGARWDVRTAIWTRDDYVAEVHESIEEAQRVITVLIHIPRIAEPKTRNALD